MQISSVMYPAIHAKLNGMYAKKIRKEELEEVLKQNTTTRRNCLFEKSK